MSCILYSQASYDALGDDSLFCKICTELALNPKRVTNVLFGINCKASRSRYYDIENIEDDIMLAVSNTKVNEEFKTYLKTPTLASLKYLLNRIDYQYCEDGVDRLAEYNDIFVPLLKLVQLNAETGIKPIRFSQNYKL